MGGVTTIAARAVVLKQVQREKKGLGSRYEKRLATLLFFLLEGSSHVCSFLAPWFGPASLVLPTEGSSKLLSNVIVVGAILQHEKFDKRTLVGTAMVAIGVIYLPINGPKPQDNQDLVELIVQDPVALVWLSTTFSCYIVSVLTMFCCNLTKFQPRNAETVLLMVSTFSKLGNAVSKCASLSEQYGSVARGILLALLLNKRNGRVCRNVSSASQQQSQQHEWGRNATRPVVLLVGNASLATYPQTIDHLLLGETRPVLWYKSR
jgi:uncharacterized membrane protein